MTCKQKCAYINLAWLAAVVMVCAFGGTGYQYTVVNLPRPDVEEFINNTLEERFGIDGLDKTNMAVFYSFIVACQGFGALIGCYLGRYCAEKIGRKWTVMGVQSASIALGSALVFISRPSGPVELLFIGRFIIGISTGVTLTTVSMFLLECTPVSFRGLVGSLGTLATLLGDAVARGIGSAANDSNWSYIMGATVAPGLLLLVLAPIFHESPKYLLLKKKDEAKCKASLAFYHGKHKAEKELIKIRNEETTEHHVSLRELFKYEVYRTPMFLAVAINAAAAAGGLFAVFAYSSAIFESLDLHIDVRHVKAQVLIPAGLLAGVAQIFLIHRVKRRFLVLLSLGMVIACHSVFLVCALVAKAYDLIVPRMIAGITIIIAVIFLNLGVASVSLFLPAEISLLPARSLTATAGALTRTVGTLITQLCFHTLQTAIGNWVFMFFIVFSSICFLYLAAYLPETRGKTLNEIVQPWLRRESRVVPADVYAIHVLETQKSFDRKDSSFLDYDV